MITEKNFDIYTLDAQGEWQFSNKVSATDSYHAAEVWAAYRLYNLGGQGLNQIIGVGEIANFYVGIVEGELKVGRVHYRSVE